MNPTELAGAVGRAKDFFEHLSRADTQRMAQIYTDDAWFKDPFNEVSGVDRIAAIFNHMFDQVERPRFVVTDAVAQGDSAFLTWDFIFSSTRMGGEQTVRGASHLKFAADGRISYHRDYWDVAEELYEKIPLLGGLMRFLKKRAAS